MTSRRTRIEWPRNHLIVVALILTTFWVSGFVFSINHGNKAFHRTDETSEQVALYGANYWVEHGFWKTHLMPMAPPFGFDSQGNVRTEPFIYTHYFAGPQIIITLVMKTFGADLVWMTRLIPLSLTVLALGFLTFEFAQMVGSSLMGCILLLLLMIPRSLTIFSICMFGQSYVMAFYLMLMAVLIGMQNRAQMASGGSGHLWNRPWFAWSVGLLFGFLQMQFCLDWVPLTFIAAISITAFLTKLDFKHARRVVIGFFIGACFAMIYQITMASLEFGSLKAVIDDFVMFGKWRMGAIEFEKDVRDNLSLARVLHEYNRQAYGATGFTGQNLFALSCLFLILGFVGKIKSSHEAKRGLFAIITAYLAAAVWNILMRRHSMAHTHFIPRHYFVMYLMLLLTALPICYELVIRSRKEKQS